MQAKPAVFMRLLAEVRGCRICETHLPNPPKPVLRASPTARVRNVCSSARSLMRRAAMCGTGSSPASRTATRVGSVSSSLWRGR